jgi:hypothetical protein
MDEIRKWPPWTRAALSLASPSGYRQDTSGMLADRSERRASASAAQARGFARIRA